MGMGFTTVKLGKEEMKVLRSIAQSLEKLANPMYMSENQGEMVIDKQLEKHIANMMSKSGKDILDEKLSEAIRYSTEPKGK